MVNEGISGKVFSFLVCMYENTRSYCCYFDISVVGMGKGDGQEAVW